MSNQNLIKKCWAFPRTTLLLLFSFLAVSGLAVAQQRIVTGQVHDQNNLPLAGVSVTVKDKPATGTATDADGNFSISASVTDILVFEFVGHQKEERKADGTATLRVVLQQLETALDEVIVIGYGTKLKGELTGAVSKVGNETFETRPLTNTMNALQGSLPGVTVTRGSGRPGFENYSMQVRGASSMGGSRVLVLIDGIPGDLNLINPNDIADLTVLKDAAASIYGARAADGVVIVTTKKGNKGAPSILYSGNYGVKTPQFLKKRTNTLQLAEMYDEGMRNVNQPGVSEEVFNKIRANAEPDPTGWLKYLENFPGFYQSHDWIDDVFGTGIQQMHNLSLSGGGDYNSYLFSAGYQRNEGIFRHGENHSERYNLRMNYDFKVSDKITVETRTSFENQPTVSPTALGSILYYVNQMGSYVPIYNPLGQLYKYQGGFRNPIQYLREAGTNKDNAYRLSSNVKGNLKLLDDLLLVGQAGVIVDFTDRKETRPTFAQHNWDGSDFDIVNSPNSALFTHAKNVYQNYTAYLDYNKTFAGKHKVNVMAGASRETKTYENQSITGYNFVSNDIFTLNLADRTKTEYANFSGGASDWALQSYFGRLSYAYGGKYLVDFTTRMDGSSKFAKDKRWSALFPSVAVAWNLSEESFIQSMDVFDNLKARLSWGQSGNQELNFGNYDYISLISMSGAYPMGTPNVGLPGAVSSIASQSRTWETIETKNAGIDFGFLTNRLTGSIDYYIKNNKNMLVNDQLPATLGGSAPTQNIGKLETKGWDFSIAWNDQIGNFKYRVSAMLSDSKNKLLELKGNDAYGEGLIYAREGYSLNSYFGYQYKGIIQNAEQLAAYKQLGNVPANLAVGDVMYGDVDGDGKITAFGDAANGTQGDMVYLGNLLPRYAYSSTIDLSYKGFDLSIFLQGIGKREGIRTGEFSNPFPSVWMQPLEYFYGKNWTPDNPDAKYPRLVPGAVGYDEIKNWDWRYSSMRMNNLAYLRLKVLTLAYNLPQPFVRKAKMQQIRVYVSGQDLFTFSKGTWNKSFDPEETWERSDEQTYPFNSIISFGLDIKF
ncbi:SusC/RagA family TonB-linked outer membrane protein [Parapedobacter sp. 2B3]|uniref:SusC/RagA family TonB-linked outer membrane protein n=1 Tax=Parapedobacter sp. 2B3 TaxID=3342381 RepID=UPI0035B65D1C